MRYAKSTTVSGSAGLLSRWDATTARTVVLFGGSPYRRDEVVRLLGTQLDVTVVGALDEAEGMATLADLGDAVDLVLIGGAYSADQRDRIRRYVAGSLPGRPISEPGFDYPYANDAIVADVAAKLAQSR